MLEKFGKIGNPLTIIGIFAGTIEVSGICVLPWLVEANQNKFVWFLIIFPILLVLLFFSTLNFNPKVLYAPSDYREDCNFLAALNIRNNTIPEPQEGISVGEIKNIMRCQMIKNVRNTFHKVTVKLDNTEFIECHFINCTLEYSGLGPVSLQGCNFQNINWVFTGPAQNTLQFMRGIYHGAGEGGRQLIEKTFENIRKPL